MPRLADITRTEDVVAAMTSIDRAQPAAVEYVVEQSGDWSLRRWEAASTTRLNAAQWQGAVDSPINDDLSGFLSTLRARCEFEAARNPMVAGAIKTHQDDLIGDSGPTLQIEVLDDDYPSPAAYAAALEAVWRRWFDDPDASGQRNGVDVLKQWVRQRYWTAGEYVEQFVTVERVDSPITMRLLAIAPRRLQTPLNRTGERNITMGIERDRNGRPQRYHIERVDQVGDFALQSGVTDPVPADLILHGFEQQEPDQARGVPGLAVALQAIADCRQFDQFVLDAAKGAAATGVVLWTQHADAPFVLVNESTELERNTQNTAPPGWQPMQLNPGQPAANYVEYRKERQIEIGRHVAMPLLSIRADASRHNFSSAHFDSQSYQRSNRVAQRELAKSLVRCVQEVKREAELAAKAGDRRVPAVLSRPPRNIRITFKGWPTRPHVDPKKVRDGNQTAMATLQLAMSDVLAGDGKEFDEHLKSVVSECQAMAKMEIRPGLSVLDLWLAQLRPPQDPIDETVDEDGEDEETPATSTKNGRLAHA